MFELFKIASAVAETAAVDPAAVPEEIGMLGMIIQIAPMLLIFVAMYFIMIRPQRKKDKKVKEMLAAVKVTDRITTIGGIHGTVVGIKDDNIVLSVGKDNVQMVMARWAIRTVDEEQLENDAEALN
jgi:preprotein translocase, YajC subunit